MLNVGSLYYKSMTVSKNKSLSTQSVDHVISTIKSVLGTVPIVGPFLTEVVGTLVPNQRLDRIAEFAQMLHDRIETLEQEILKDLAKDEEFTDLLEESLQQVARTTSEDRRKYIANLVASGINDKKMQYVQDKHLLRILGEINDIEVIWLIAYAVDFSKSNKSEFQKKHKNVLDPIASHKGSSQREHDKRALQDSYKQHLERLNLLKINNRESYNISSLGRLLVRRIGMEDVT